MPDNFLKKAIKVFNINDDKGNALNLPSNTKYHRTELNSGNASSVLVNMDRDKKDISLGFTPEEYYIQHLNRKNDKTGLPAEYGDSPAHAKSATQSLMHNQYLRLKTTSPSSKVYGDSDTFGSQKTFEKFKDQTQFDFAHDLGGDKLNLLSGNGLKNIDALKDIYLGSFISTSNDNEDPTMFGYDIKILYTNSPLFNGSINDFINKFKSDKEIKSREGILSSFQSQFFKFFKREISNSITGVTQSSANTSGPNDLFNTYGGKKAYYLKKISGLDKLTEGDVSSNSEGKSMVDYGKDLITLDLYEDVSMNIGYLASLYKMLSWSRLNGKQIIPENLLRFDAEITITEIRNYNRIIKVFDKSKDLNVFPDSLSKYTYTLYDCQFIFDKLSHGDSIDMWASKLSDDVTISFNYKFSTLAISKFSIYKNEGEKIVNNQQKVLDNSNLDPYEIKPGKSNSAQINNSGINLELKPITLSSYGTYSNQTFEEQMPLAQPISVIESQKKKFKDKLKRNVSEILGKKLKEIAKRELNKQINTQVMLLNKTLDNIRNSIGLGKMSYPTNIYSGYGLKSDVQNAVRDFVGESLKDIFSGK